jgi:hypothetical protein
MSNFNQVSDKPLVITVREAFTNQLSTLINQNNIDNELGVRDYILAKVMIDAMISFGCNFNQELRMKGHQSTAISPLIK